MANHFAYTYPESVTKKIPSIPTLGRIILHIMNKFVNHLTI